MLIDLQLLYVLRFLIPSVEDKETIEQVLFLLDKFCASDKLYP